MSELWEGEEWKGKEVVMLTAMGTDAEREVLKELDPIIQKWVKKLNVTQNLRFGVEQVESSIAYLWKHRADVQEEEYRKHLSRYDMGIYGGR